MRALRVVVSIFLLSQGVWADSPHLLLNIVQYAGSAFPLSTTCSATHVGDGRVLTAAHCLPRGIETGKLPEDLLIEGAQIEEVLYLGDLDTGDDVALLKAKGNFGVSETEASILDSEYFGQVKVTGFLSGKLVTMSCYATTTMPRLYREGKDISDWQGLEGSLFLFGCDKTPTSGFSGALVVDEKGRRIGIYRGLQKTNDDLESAYLELGQTPFDKVTPKKDFLFGVVARIEKF